MKRFLQVMLTLSFVGLIGGRLIMWYGCNYNNNLIFGTGFVIYVISLFSIFLFALPLCPNEFEQRREPCGQQKL